MVRVTKGSIICIYNKMQYPWSNLRKWRSSPNLRKIHEKNAACILGMLLANLCTLNVVTISLISHILFKLVLTSDHYSGIIISVMASQISNFDGLLNRLFRRTSKKTSKLYITGLFEGNSLVTSAFTGIMISAHSVLSIWNLICLQHLGWAWSDLSVLPIDHMI